MAIISLNYGYKLDSKGRKLPLCLFECDICKKQRVVTKHSYYKKVGIERCDECNSRIAGEMAKNKVWTQEERDRVSKGTSKEKSHFWNPNREEIKLKRKLRNKCYNSLKQALECKTERGRKICYERHGFYPEELIKRLESTWEPWMNWSNYGRGSDGKWDKKTWTIEHIRGIDSFYNEGITDVKIINSLDNLKAMEAKTNFSQSNRKKKFRKQMQF